MRFLLPARSNSRSTATGYRLEKGCRSFYYSFAIGWFMLLLLPGKAEAQPMQVLTLEQVLNIVREYHPIARQANLMVDSAEAARLSARGSFDPAFYYDRQKKTFNGKDYYYYNNPELKIPTWYGIDVKAGLEDNGGDRLMSEITAGKSSYIGLSMPIVKNLWTDKRRTAVQQAKLLVQQSKASRLNELNNLLYNASAAYWDWYREYQVYLVLQSVIKINEARLELVKRSFLGGDKAAIDTVEALTQLQGFQSLAADARYRFISAGLELSNYLWLTNDQPYELPSNVVPDSTWSYVKVEQYPLPSFEDALLSAQTIHPKIQTLDRKIEVLQAERRLKFQSLLPTFNFNYNFLRKGYEPWKNVGQNVFDNNYKYGLEFGLPLLLRQARGDYRGAKIKILSTDLQREQTKWENQNKVKDYYTQLTTLREQVTIYEAALENYIKLLKAEEIKFSIGESSLFLLNSRENKVLDTRQKLLELRSKFFKATVAVQWAAGTLP